jgi:hypothetical protein
MKKPLLGKIIEIDGHAYKLADADGKKQGMRPDDFCHLYPDPFYVDGNWVKIKYMVSGDPCKACVIPALAGEMSCCRYLIANDQREMVRLCSESNHYYLKSNPPK